MLGIKIDNLNHNEVMSEVNRFLTNGGQHYIVLLYSEFIVQACRDRDFKEIINNADLSLCDGRGLWLMSYLTGEPLKEQIPGVELMEVICDNWPKIFLFGGEKQVAAKVAGKFGKNIIGTADGYDGQKDIIKKINQVRPEILFVALGMPAQEKWIVQNLRQMPSVKIAIGVGGAFDFIAGRIKRAPKVVRCCGLEWLWRLARQPRRARRVINAVVVFPWLVLKEKLFYGFNKN